MPCTCPQPRGHDYQNASCQNNDPAAQVAYDPNRYSAFIRTDGQTLAILPGAQATREEAEAQVTAFMRFMTQFPGGTQAVAGWVEPVLAAS